MSQIEAVPELASPQTPPHERDEEKEGSPGNINQKGRARKRPRRAKGRKKRQRSSLLITNEDGSEFVSTAAASNAQGEGDIDGGVSGVIQPPSKILRPTSLNAPRNSTQFIIDDHEDSQLFWNFDKYVSRDHQQSNSVRYSPDDDNFWCEYSNRDFEDVYQSVHQEEVFSWERERIVSETRALEKKQAKLLEMLSAIDPLIYLQKLQGELLSLQEVNRQLKLVNIAERLHRHERLEGGVEESMHQDHGNESDSSDSSSSSSSSSSSCSSSSSSSSSSSTAEFPLPDSTSQDAELLSTSVISDAEGGCLSGCCLAQLIEDQQLLEMEENMEEDSQENKQDDLVAIEDYSQVVNLEANNQKRLVKEADKQERITKEDNKQERKEIEDDQHERIIKEDNKQERIAKEDDKQERIEIEDKKTRRNNKGRQI